MCPGRFSVLFFPSPFVLCVFKFCYFTFSGWGRGEGLWVWEYLKRRCHRAPAPALLDSARAPQRAPAPAPARHVLAPHSVALLAPAITLSIDSYSYLDVYCH